MYPYQREVQLRQDYQKGRPIVEDQIDREFRRQAEMVKRFNEARSVFNPTSKYGFNKPDCQIAIN